MAAWLQNAETHAPLAALARDDGAGGGRPAGPGGFAVSSQLHRACLNVWRISTLPLNHRLPWNGGAGAQANARGTSGSAAACGVINAPIGGGVTAAKSARRRAMLGAEVAPVAAWRRQAYRWAAARKPRTANGAGRFAAVLRRLGMDVSGRVHCFLGAASTAQEEMK